MPLGRDAMHCVSTQGALRLYPRMHCVSTQGASRLWDDLRVLIRKISYQNVAGRDAMLRVSASRLCFASLIRVSASRLCFASLIRVSNSRL